MKISRSALISALLLSLELYCPMANAQHVLRPGDTLDINDNLPLSHETAVTVLTQGGLNPIRLNINAPAGGINQITTQAEAEADFDAINFNSAVFMSENVGPASFEMNIRGPVSVASSVGPSLPNTLYYSPALLLRGNATINLIEGGFTGDIQVNYNHSQGGPNNVVINVNGGTLNGNLFTSATFFGASPALGTVNINTPLNSSGYIRGFSQLVVNTPGVVNVAHVWQATQINLLNTGTLHLNAGGALRSTNPLINNATIVFAGGELNGDVTGSGTLSFLTGDYTATGNLTGQNIIINPGITFTLNAPYTISSPQSLLMLGQSTLKINGGSINANIRDDGMGMLDIEGPFTATAGKSIQVATLRVNALGGNGALITHQNSPITGFNHFTIFAGGQAALAGGATSLPGGSIVNHGSLKISNGLVTAGTLTNAGIGKMTVTGGTITPLVKNKDNAEFLMTGGTLQNGLSNSSQSKVKIQAGTLNGAVTNDNVDAIFEIAGGTFNDVVKNLAGTMNVSGGNFNAPIHHEGGQLNLKGGTIYVPAGLINSAHVALQGTTTLVGNYVQNEGSTLSTTIKDRTNFGQLKVTENATIHPSHLNVTFTQDSSLKEGDSLDLVTARNGHFSNLNISMPHNSPFKFSQEITSDHLRLNVERSYYLVKMAATPHAQAVAQAIEDVRFINTEPGFADFLHTLDNSPQPVINNALTAVAPNHTHGLFYSGRSPMRMAINKAEHRMALGRSGVNLVKTGYSSGDLCGERGSYGPIGFFNGATQNNKDGVSGYKSTTQGFGLLGDVAVNDYLQLGAGVIYAGTAVRTDHDSGKTNISSAEAMIYGGLNRGRAFVDGAIVGAQNWYRMRRHVFHGGKDLAHSKHTGTQFSGKIRTGYSIPFCDFAVTPLASLMYTSLHQKAFKEHNKITRFTNSQNSHLSEAGAGLNLTFFGESDRFIPEIHALYLYDLNNPKLQVNSQFSGASAAFILAGPNNPGKQSVVVGGGLTAFVAKNVLITATYDFEKKRQFRSHSGIVKLRWVF